MAAHLTVGNLKKDALWPHCCVLLQKMPYPINQGKPVL